MRVVVVRGARGDRGGSGCCSGDVRPFDEGGRHGHCPDESGPQGRARDEPGRHGHVPHAFAPDEVGALYRALRTALPDDVAVELVAPTNWVWLVPTLVAGGRRRGVRGRALVRWVRAGLRTCSVLVDGEPVFSGGLPPAPVVVEEVRRRRQVPADATAGGPGRPRAE